MMKSGNIVKKLSCHPHRAMRRHKILSINKFKNANFLSDKVKKKDTAFRYPFFLLK